MKDKFKTKLLLIIIYLYVFLFIYAAFSKVIDFDTFKVQLGQSPLLSAFAEIIAIIVPSSEIIIALLLCIPRWRYVALLGAFNLMVMFSTYIIIILNYSSFIPCSCGGVLSDMNWTQHLFFNLTFVALAGIGILLFQNKKAILHLTIGAVVSILTISLLFLVSEEKMHRNNGFVRRYPHHPITTVEGIPIDYNSYYLAGFENGNIILGNSTAPQHLLKIDTLLKNKTPVQIKITDSKDYPFSSLQVKVMPPYFYVVDGSIPIIYKGNTKSWEAATLFKKTNKFSLLEPTSTDNFVVRSSKTSGEHTLGVVNKFDNYEFKERNNMLQKKIDGVFDTDGMMTYNEHLNKIIYTYYYRNTFIATDADLTNVELGKTIDTITQVPLEFAYLNSNTEKKLAKQPLTVNKYATSTGKYLFIKSERLGKYESEKIAKQASIIDVYDLENKTYEFSFYLYHYKNEEIKSFKIYNNILIGLTENHLIKCKLKSKYFNLK